MLSLNNDFLGYHPLEHNVSFSGSDSEQLYLENLKSKPVDWYYRTNKISYERNSNGHRCKEINDIDLDNYILFTGCSHTEGIGLELETTYPYLLSKQLNCDYYNLSVGGTSTDTISYNLMTWFAKVKKPPKLLILQWSENLRFILKDFENTENFNPEPWHSCGIWSAKEPNKVNAKSVGNFLISSEEIGFFETTNELAKKLIYNIVPCPIIEVTSVLQKNNNGSYYLLKIDSARDVRGHLGIKSQLFNSTMIYREAIKLINT
jgi:hypothetical protein